MLNTYASHTATQRGEEQHWGRGAVWGRRASHNNPKFPFTAWVAGINIHFGRRVSAGAGGTNSTLENHRGTKNFNNSDISLESSLHTMNSLSWLAECPIGVPTWRNGPNLYTGQSLKARSQSLVTLSDAFCVCVCGVVWQCTSILCIVSFIYVSTILI